MYCPRCGTNNPEEGHFCRKCGCDLSGVAGAISDTPAAGGRNRPKKKKKNATWEEALTLLFVSVAFFIISAFLAFQPMAAFWWFWILVPAFATAATGIAKLIELRRVEREERIYNTGMSNSLPDPAAQTALPPKRTEPAADLIDIKRPHGEKVPPSVVEATTRNLNKSTDASYETSALPLSSEDE